MKKAKLIHRTRLRQSKQKRICYHDWERHGQTMMAYPLDMHPLQGDQDDGIEVALIR